MQTKTSRRHILDILRHIVTPKTIPQQIFMTILLSWFYALCAQISIPLPFNLIPLSIHPLPIFICINYFGWTAVFAYIAYLIQGGLGAPFFAQGHGGFMRLLGPTGGYLWGFLGAALYIAITRSWHKKSRTLNVFRYWIAAALYFLCGILQLTLFTSPVQALTLGLYPFLIGDFIIKPCLFIFGIPKHKN